MCMYAPGGAIDTTCSDRQDIRSRTTEGLERQPDDLAVPAVSARLARVELIGHS
ncbi:hypothetical protein [Bradyrhizobium sp. P5_C11_2]